MPTILRTQIHSRHRGGKIGTGLLAWCFRALLDWDRRARERGQLRSLDDRALADLGLTRADILRAAKKHFWQR